jgi:type VI secretion system secreted protein VgrG/serine protease AprX
LAQIIQPELARSYGDVSGEGLTVAVIDTGIKTLHPLFENRIIATKNFVENETIEDEFGHGTFVAGVITGIAPGAKLLPVKAGNRQGVFHTTEISSAFEWIYANREQYNITAVNYALGGGNFSAPEAWMNFRREILGKLKDAGIAVSVSVGNGFFQYDSKPGMGWMAVLPETISVGGTHHANYGTNKVLSGAIAYTTGTDRIAHFTQRHEDTDIFAPVIERSAFIDEDYVTREGTTISTALVSGAVLLIQEFSLRRRGRLPEIEEIKTILRQGAKMVYDGDDEDDNVVNTMCNYPRLDILRSIEVMEGSLPGTKSLSVLKAKIRLNFKRESRDSCFFRIELEDRKIPEALTVGNLNTAFTEKNGILKVKIKRASLDFSKYGLTNQVRNVETFIPVTAILNEAFYMGRASMRYRVKTGVRGKARLVR